MSYLLSRTLTRCSFLPLLPAPQRRGWGNRGPSSGKERGVIQNICKPRVSLWLLTWLMWLLSQSTIGQHFTYCLRGGHDSGAWPRSVLQETLSASRHDKESLFCFLSPSVSRWIVKKKTTANGLTAWSRVGHFSAAERNCTSSCVCRNMTCRRARRVLWCLLNYREKLNSAFHFAGCRSSRGEEWDHVFVRKIHTWVINASCASEAKHMRKQSCDCRAGKQDFPCRKAASSPGNGNSQDEVKSQHTRETERGGREREKHT